MIDRLNAALDFYAQALNLRATRQNVLASNVANSDTPHFKARDFDFTRALDAAVSARDVSASGSGKAPALDLSRTRAGHIGPADGGSPMALAYRTPGQPSLDGNTVDMDVERIQFMDNAVHYRADLQILGSQVKSLKAAMEPPR